MTGAKVLALAAALWVTQAWNRLEAVVPYSGLATDASAVNFHFSKARTGELEMIKAAGFKRVRVDFSWPDTEKEKGVYDFTEYELLMDQLSKLGLKAFFILSYSNRLYEEEQSVRTDAGRAAFAKWGAAVVKHFQGHGILWEVWSEPNSNRNWMPKNDVQEYLALAKVTCEAIHEVAPNECIVGPGTIDVDLFFIDTCIQGGMLKFWHGVSIHPYRPMGPETVEPELPALRALIAKNAPKGSDIPVLTSEWGYSSSWPGYDVALQAQMLARQSLMCAAMGIPVNVWFSWRDNGEDPTNAHFRFGTVGYAHREHRDPVYETKPAYHAAQTFNRELDGYRFVKRVRMENLQDYALLFERKGAQRLAVWTMSTTPRQAAVPSDSGRFATVGHLGQILPEVTAAGGKLDLELTDAPAYIKFEEMNQLLQGAVEAVPATMEVLPCTDAEAVVKLLSYSGKPVQGQVVLDDLQGISVTSGISSVSLTEADPETYVKFPLTQPPGLEYKLGASLKLGGVTALTQSPRQFFAQPAVLSQGLNVELMGAKPGMGTVQMTQAQPPVPPPGGGGQTWRVQANFPEGLSSARVYLNAANTQLVHGLDQTGHLKSFAKIGMWIHGNNAGVIPRIRILDAAGRT
ncbi:MAG TPA: cellulase family glycosylhydrolase, partial [Verrucomicrobium sp.]|nr:cellulase family glycosylhydrolase [Verrucomicrobium sp.]